MFKKRLITISALTFVTALLLGGSLIISKKSEKVSALNETHEHEGWTGVTELPTIAGDYNIYLNDDITLSSTWTVPEGTTNLCLNGHNIIMTEQDQNVISIGSDATLNLYDCGTQYQFFEEDANGLWLLLDEQDIPTDYAINGGCISGAHSSDQASGVYCEAGTFNMYGGNIVGNTGLGGPGVYCTSVFNMYGGTIVGNSTIGNGGGVYVSSDAVCILTGGTITGNTALQGSGVQYKGPACFVEGTEITMADGSKQSIENLAVGDSVRVFDHNEGILSSSKLFDVGKYEQQQSDAMTLHFTSDIDLTVVYGHSFFEREENKYVSVTKDNVSNYVGEEFYNADNNCWETLIGYDLINEKVDTYIIVTEYDLNCVASGMLSVEDGFYTALLNTFDYGEDLKVDATKKAQDLEDYGVYGFENIKNVSKHTYDVLGLDRLNVTFGKHLFSEAKFSYLESACPEYDPEIYLVDKETKQVSKKMPLKSGVEPPVSAPIEAGLYVGGSIKITGNNGGNLYIPTAESIVIGTGTVGEGNGVPAPTDEMLIGVTLQEGSGAFTASGVEDYSANFFSDDENYAVRFNKGTEENPGDYLALETILTITNNNPKTSKDTYNGYIELSGSAVAGDEVSVTVFPNDGYKLASLIYNDGEKDHDIEDLSFVMPEINVSVSATFEEKAEQVVTIVLDEEFIYPNTPSIREAGLYVYSNYYEKLGDGEATVEFKPKGADDSEYTTEVPTEYGEYTVRVSVAEGSEYLAGFATKDFIYSPQVITQVGFGNLKQPVAGAVAPEKTTSMLVNTKYLETVTWDPEITTTNAEGKGIFDCGTTYTAKVTLTLKDAYKDNYVFADPGDIVLKGAGTGWTLSVDSTNKTLIYTKEFETTDDHSVSKVSGTVSCTTDGYLDAYKCEVCGLYYEDEACTLLIGDADAYDAWKEGDGKSSPIGHDMTHHDAVAPTCTEDGNVEYWTCSRDEGVFYANAQGTATLTSIVDPKLGHDMTHHEAVAPTCTEDGTVEYWTCSRETGVYYADAQGKSTLDSIVDPKTGHQMTYHEAVAPTCTEDGTIAYWSCSHEEGIYYADAQGNTTLSSIVDTKLGHDLIHHDGKEPTCTEAGWEAYDTCSRCDYSTYVEIPALDHEVSLVEGFDPTYKNDGYKPAYKCSACGKYFEDEDCTKLIGDETAYNAWKANAGHLDKLVKKSNTGLIIGLAVGGFFLLLLIIYLIGYFFSYRKGKLDERKIKVIYKILPRGSKNLSEEKDASQQTK